MFLSFHSLTRRRNQMTEGALDTLPPRGLHRQVPRCLLYVQRPYVGGNK